MKIKYLAPLFQRLAQFFILCKTKVISLFISLYEYILFQLNPFWYHLFYYTLVSLLGYFSLKLAKQSKSPVSASYDDNLNLFFTSVSATTISSMSTVNMEDFSTSQLVILLFLMLSGGEVFLSILGLRFRMAKLRRRERQNNVLHTHNAAGIKYTSLRKLEKVVLGFLLVSHVIGYSLISLYLSMVPSASNVLEAKRIEMHLFSIFVTISTFSNCGFIPTNENMMVFKENSGLLLILIPLILLGNKLYPCCLRLVIWVLEKLTKKPEFGHILESSEELGYGLLVSKFDVLYLATTAVGLVTVQFVVFCLLEWNSVVLMGLNWRQKLVGSLFQTVNSRHSGESVVDLSVVSPAMMVLFVVMMYLPSYTTFVPIEYTKEAIEEQITIISSTSKRHNSSHIFDNLRFTQLTYLAISVILICYTEHVHLKEDPLNFNVFNIIFEVVSAYGNVGFSMGYSCSRRVVKREKCKDEWYGFVGRWTRPGKLILIFVMFFGRLKRFNFDGGKAWKLSI